MALDEDRPLLRLLRGYPIDVVVEPGCGRLAVAARDLEPGEVVLESLCFAKTMTPASRKHWCWHCTGFASKRLKNECRTCGLCYCSKECRAAAPGCSSPGPAPAPVCLARQALAQTPGLTEEEHAMAALLLDEIVRGAASAPGDGDADGSGDAQPAEAAPAGGPEASGGGFWDASQVPPPQLADLMELYVPSADSLRANDQGSFIDKWATAAAAVRGALDAHGLSALAAAASERAGGAPLPDIASRDLCNAFWVWDRAGRVPEGVREGGYGVFPGASLFNHSCIPNLRHDHLRSRRGPALRFSAVHFVPKGEPLSIRYVDPDWPYEQRAAELKRTWGFECACMRCRLSRERDAKPSADGRGGGEEAAAPAEGEGPWEIVETWDATHYCKCGYPKVVKGSTINRPPGWTPGDGEALKKKGPYRGPPACHCASFALIDGPLTKTK